MNQIKGALPFFKGYTGFVFMSPSSAVIIRANSPLSWPCSVSPPPSPLGQSIPTNQFPSISLPNRKRVIKPCTSLHSHHHYIYPPTFPSSITPIHQQRFTSLSDNINKWPLLHP